jgi:hypothetical protein
MGRPRKIVEHLKHRREGRSPLAKPLLVAGVYPQGKLALVRNTYL